MFITVQVGDMLIQATDSQTLDKDDPIPVHHLLFFRDLPTGRTAEVSCESEVEQANFVAAWLVSDEENIGMLQPYLDKLKEKLPKDGKGREIFLP